jgi:hypothetical protein
MNYLIYRYCTSGVVLFLETYMLSAAIKVKNCQGRIKKWKE